MHAMFQYLEIMNIEKCKPFSSTKIRELAHTVLINSVDKCLYFVKKHKWKLLFWIGFFIAYGFITIFQRWLEWYSKIDFSFKIDIQR